MGGPPPVPDFVVSPRQQNLDFEKLPVPENAVFRCAIADHHGTDSNHLSFLKGDRILVLREKEGAVWAIGERSGLVCEFLFVICCTESDRMREDCFQFLTLLLKRKIPQALWEQGPEETRDPNSKSYLLGESFHYAFHTS